MKYSEKVYVGALTALEGLKKNISESEVHALDFIAEAVAEKGDRDHPRTNGDLIRSLSDEELAVFLAETRADICRAAPPVVVYRGADVNNNFKWLGLELDGDKEKFHGPY